MKTDYDIIKDKYGEKLAKLCRSYFPTILEHHGLLSHILTNNFAENHHLLDDIIKNQRLDSFKSFIYGHFYELVNADRVKGVEKRVIERPEVLMDKAGYKLYKCENNEDIAAFKKYYMEGEELCTFRDPERIDNYDIFWAVKKNVDDIKRADFKYPMRQDEYGTSVISIQFLKGENSILSIKNRYNHKVLDPDATFANDLDNIIAGLTESFVKYYNIDLVQGAYGLDLPGYTRTSNGKFYPYNNEINNVYFCPDNIIISNGEAIKFDKSQYEMFDYFIFDKVNKEFINPYEIEDGFTDNVNFVKKIETMVDKQSKERTLKITFTDKKNSKTNKYFIVTTNERNQVLKAYVENTPDTNKPYYSDASIIRSLVAPNIKKLPTYSLGKCLKHLTELKMDSVTEIGERVLNTVLSLEELHLPNVRQIRQFSFNNMSNLKILNLPSLENLEMRSFAGAPMLTSVYVPKLRYMDTGCFAINNIKNLSLPMLKKMGYGCFQYSNNLQRLYIPELQHFASTCFEKTNALKELNLQKITQLPQSCFREVNCLENLIADNLINLQGKSFVNAPSLKNIHAPNLKELGVGSFFRTKALEDLYLPSAVSLGAECFKHSNIKNVDMDNLEKMAAFCFNEAQEIETAKLNKLTEMGNFCFKDVQNLSTLVIPKLKHVGVGCFNECNSLKTFYAPRLTLLDEGCLQHAQEIEEFHADKLLLFEEHVLEYAPNLKVLYAPFLSQVRKNSLTRSSNIDKVVVSAGFKEQFMPNAIKKAKNVKSKFLTDDDWVRE